MTQMTITASSETLRRDVHITALLPRLKYTGKSALERKNVYKSDPPFPCLYLLHGMSGSGSNWLRFTNVENYAQQTGLAIIMPGVENSHYVNTAYGENYFDFITDELPQMAEKYFRIKTNPSHRFIAGNSMGGYGTLLRRILSRRFKSIFMDDFRV